MPPRLPTPFEQRTLRCKSTRNIPAASSSAAVPLAGAASFALPYLIPSGVLAADGQPGANDRIGIAGIGIGRQGTGVLQGALGFKECRFIGDRRRDPAAGRGDCASGLAASRIRTIASCWNARTWTPSSPPRPTTGGPWSAIHACQAGKDVYAEKALSLTIREGRLMVEAARKYKRVFQVGSQQRSQAVNRIACEYIRTGELGKIKEVDRLQLSQPVGMRAAGPAGARGTRLGHVVRPDAAGAVPQGPVHAAGQARLDLLPALFRRRDDRLGRPRPRPDPMGPGHGRQRAGRGLDRGRQVQSADLHRRPNRAPAATRSARCRWSSSATPTASS